MMFSTNEGQADGGPYVVVVKVPGLMLSDARILLAALRSTPLGGQSGIISRDAGRLAQTTCSIWHAGAVDSLMVGWISLHGTNTPR